MGDGSWKMEENDGRVVPSILKRSREVCGTLMRRIWMRLWCFAFGPEYVQREGQGKCFRSREVTWLVWLPR
jgi:hypothetical protein